MLTNPLLSPNQWIYLFQSLLQCGEASMHPSPASTTPAVVWTCGFMVLQHVCDTSQLKPNLGLYSEFWHSSGLHGWASQDLNFDCKLLGGRNLSFVSITLKKYDLYTDLVPSLTTTMTAASRRMSEWGTIPEHKAILVNVSYCMPKRLSGKHHQSKCWKKKSIHARRREEDIFIARLKCLIGQPKRQNIEGGGRELSC